MRTIIDCIEDRVSTSGEQAQFTLFNDAADKRRTLTLGEVRQGAVRIASQLQASVPVFILETCPLSFVQTFFGCLYAGAIAVPVSMPTRRRGLDHLKQQMRSLGSRQCISRREIIDRLRQWYGDDEVGKGIEWIDSGVLLRSDRFSERANRPESSDAAVIQFTSGSTGSQKAVVVSHANIFANSRIIKDCFRNTPETTSVSWLPHYHDMGLIDGIIQPVFSGFHAVLMSPVNFLQKPSRWFRAMSEFGATYSGGPNFAFDHCVERITDDELEGIDLSRLVCLYNGSEKVRPETLERFIERFSAIGISSRKIVSCYGLAEATLAVTATKLGEAPVTKRFRKDGLSHGRAVAASHDAEYAKLVSCGRPLGDSKVIILDPESESERESGVVGEICVSGASVTSAYVSVHVRDRSRIEIAEQTFFRTGDLGFLSGEELFIVGRIKDVVIIRGRNLDPSEIERTSFLSHPALQRNGSAAFSTIIDGIEQLVVVQEVRRGAARASDLADVIRVIGAEIAEVHGVAAYDIQLITPGRLPKTTSGKVQRTKCREMWQTGGLEVIGTLLGRSIPQHA